MLQTSTLTQLKTWTWYSLDTNNLNNVPQTGGVYCLGVGDQIIYIGSSSNLNERLWTHYRSTDQCISRAKQFAIEPCSNYRERERQRLVNYQAENGRLPACNSVIP
jgi:predicted GIY-YIG superfamily endonuclease